MVFESVVADLLNRFLGDYVENLDRSQLKLGIWGGDVTLKHLDVKESALDDLDLPVKVVSGHLGQLILKIPWKNMYTAPVIATIEGLFIVVIPNLGIKYDSEKEEKAAQLAKQAELQRIEEAKTKEAEKGDTKDEKKDTFTEKLVTQIIKNLQVKIKDIHIRYEDNFSDPLHPFAVGFTLHNLSFETTNEKWIPCIIQDNVSIIHKLITLDSLALYWNSKTQLFCKLNVEERQKAMENCIATSSFNPTDVAYMLGPINSRAQLRLNSKPEADGSNFKIPKAWVNVVMEEIAVGLSKGQYQDLMKLLESFDRMTVATLYRKYRPDVPHKGHAKEWWKFCISAVLEEDIRRKRKNWSWSHMQHHRKACKEYKELYVLKLLGKKFTSDMQTKINGCEEYLDLFNITVVRKQAELEAQTKQKRKRKKFLRSSKKETKKTWGGWLGGWFTKGEAQQAQDDSTGKKIVKQFEDAMTAEEKAKLYEAIGYHEQISLAEYPKEFIENKLLFMLHNLTISLFDDIKSESQVLKVHLKEVSACVEQRPSAQALRTDAKIDSFIVSGVPATNRLIPTIVSSQQMQETNLPLLSLLFETNPLDNSCNQRVHVYAQPLEIIYDALTVNRLAEVFKPPEPVALHQLQAAAMLKLEDFKEMSALGLQYAIEQHKYLDLKVDMQPTFIIIPEKGVFESNIHLLVLSLGNFKMDSLKSDVTQATVRSLVKAGSTESEVLSTMIENAYDKFHIEVQNAEIILAAPGEHWKKARECQDFSLHLLQPVCIKVDLYQSIVNTDPRMPKMKIAGELPLLDLSISDHQLFQLLNLVKSIPLPESEVSPVTDPYKTTSSTAVADYAQVNAKAVQQAKKEAVQSFKTSVNESQDNDEISDESLSAQQTDLEAKFEIKQFGFVLSRRVENENIRMLRFAFHKFGTCITKRTFDLSADLYLGGIILEHTEFISHSGEPLKLLSTPHHESEHLFSLKYLMADKKGPDFDSVYNSTLQLITIKFTEIDVVLHQEAILSVVEFSNTMMANMDNLIQQENSETILISESATLPVSNESSEEKKVAKPKTVSKKKLESKIIDVEIRASMQTIDLYICSKIYQLTDIKIEGMQAAVTVQKSKTCVNASLKDIIVCDPTVDAIYPKILSTLTGEVLDLKMAMYNDATEDENYIDMSAVDISLGVSFGRMKIIFLNKFVSSLLVFLDHFQTAKEKVAEASAVAAVAAKHGMEQVYEKATRILLNVLIQAPVIIVPQNSKSKNSLVADLGILKVYNKFELGNKRNELGMPAIFDKITLDLQNLQLSRALVDPQSGDILAECPLLEPISFCLAVDRNLTSGWYTEKPEVDIFGKLTAVRMSATQDDYSTIMSVLSENLGETAIQSEPIKTASISSSVTVDKLKVAERPSEIFLHKEEMKAKVVDVVPQKVVTRFKFVFEMDSFSITLYTGDTALTLNSNKRNSSNSLACVELSVINIKAEVMTDNSIFAEVILVNCTLDDTRKSRAQGITRLMERITNKGTKSMISVNFDQDSAGEKKLNTKVSSFTLVVSLNYMMQLGDFFTKASTSKESSESSQSTLAVSTPKQVMPSTVVSPKEEENDEGPTTAVFLKIEQPDIVLIEDMENINSNAIFLNNEVTVQMTITPNVQIISGKISNLTFYTACFNPESRVDTMAKILSPCDIDLQFNFKKNSQHMDVLFKDLILHISPGTVQLLTNILSSLVTETAAEEKEEEQVDEDYSDIWGCQKLEDCKFWFLNTMLDKDAVAAEEDLEIPSADQVVVSNSSEQCLFTLKKVILTIEAGIGTRTVPMILLESSFQADIRDWMNNLYIGSSLSLEMSYYNEKIAVWEPLIEPVETRSGHRSWELIMEISKEAESVELSPEDEEPEEIVFQPALMNIHIVSQDVMELTASKTAIDVLTNLAQAFGEAVKQRTGSETDRPLAPYCIHNNLGTSVTVLLNNGLFQILNEEERVYNSVILESGSLPLHLTHSVSKADTKTKLSMLKKQDAKEDTSFNIKIATEDMNLVRKICVACTDKRFFHLPRRTYPGDKWGFVVNVQSSYGSKIITFHSILQVHNHFSIPVDIYYMMSGISEVEWCGTVEPNKVEYIPMYALYTPTSEIFFKPKDLSLSYSLTLEPFVWKELIDNPHANRIVHCKYKDGGGEPFFINIAGEVERIYFEETNKKTMSSSLFKLHLHPTVVLRNLLLFPISYSLQGVNKCFALKEGEKNELWTAELGKTGLEIKLLNYLDRDWVCYKTLRGDVDELSVWVFEAHTEDKKFTLELGMHTQKANGSLIMELYSPYCMVNKTKLLLTYRRSRKLEKSEGKEQKLSDVSDNEEDERQPSTQSLISHDENNVISHPADIGIPVLFSFKAKAFFSKKKAALKIQDSEWSDKFSIDAVGSSGTVVAKTKDGKTYGIGVQIKLSQSGLTKVIVFTPYYLLVNNSKFGIECKELAKSSEWILVPAKECMPFWPNDANLAQMIARYSGDMEETVPFSFKEQHTTLLSFNSKRGGLHVESQIAESSAIVTFEDYLPGHATARLVNHISKYPIKYKQSDSKEEFELAPNSFVLYTWENPLDKRMLNWTCGDKKDGVHDLVKDGIGEFFCEHEVNAYWVCFLDGLQRVLLFTEDLALATAAQEAGELERIEQEITVSLQGVGISLINNDTKLEIMYAGIASSGVVWEGRKARSKRYKPLSVKECTIIENAYQRYHTELKVGRKPKSRQSLEAKLEIDFEELIMLKPVVRYIRRSFQTGLWFQYKTSPHQVQFHAKINRLQVDNQLLDCVFPVVLAPVPPPKSVVADNAPKPFTELSIMLRRAEHSAVQQFKYFKMLIQEFHVKLDQGFINSMILFFTADEPLEKDYVKLLALDKEIVNSDLKDVAAIYSTQEIKSYYDILHFSPLKVHISFSMTGGAGQKDDGKPTAIHSDFLNLLLQSVGVTLTEIQDVVFKLDYFERQYVFMSHKQLTNEAISHYTGQAVKQVYMLVLGLDVIGNPVGLLMGLGEGVTDLFYEPFQGAIQGPEEFAEGLALGVKSLFGHAVGGAAGAVSRITGTLGKGIAALTMDKEYQKKRRQNLSRRPQDITQGLAQSGKGLVMGVFEGVTGIVTKPLEGAREEGVEGFFKGVGKGLIGVVTRPTAGAIDFASGSLEAVKRVAELSDEIKRLRPPRFIKADGVVRPYVKREAEGNKLLQEVEKGKYASTDIYEAHIPVGTDDKTFLVVTNNRIMYVTKGEVFGQWNTEWHYRWNEIKEIPSVTEKGIKILLKEPQKKKLALFGGKVAGKIVHVKDPQLCMWIIGKIEEVMKKAM